MNLRDNFKAIQKELKKTREDEKVQLCLQLIVERFFEEGEVKHSIEISAFWKDSIFESDRGWERSELTYKQRLFAHKEAKKQVQSLCDKLNEFGFKCKAMAVATQQNDGRFYFQNPWISVKL